MSRRWLTILGSALVVLILAVLGVWAWLEGQAERAREETRELSIKEPPRRIVDPTTNEVALWIDAETQRRIGLVVEPAKEVQRQKTLKLLGFSVIVPHRVTEVRAPWTGILQTADGDLPKVGDEVRTGEVFGRLLVELSPADRVQLETLLREVEGTIGETEAELSVTRNAIERLGKASDTVAGKQLIEAEGRLAILDARLTSAQTRQRTLENALGEPQSRTHFPLTVPCDGEVIEQVGRPGEVIPSASPIATVYDPRELWITALALPRQLDPAEVPQEAKVVFPGFDLPVPSAKLVRIKHQVERQQQAIELVYAATNPDGRIAVGLQAEVHVDVGSPMDVLAVPRSAVLQINDRRVVYVQRGPDEFAQKAVEVADEDKDFVYLRRTFDASAAVVIRGAQVLLSEENKEQIQLVEEGGEKK